MNDLERMANLRERLSKSEVRIEHQADTLKQHTEQLTAGRKRMDDISERSNQIEDRLENIERMMRLMNKITRWGIAGIGTMMMESITGTFRSLMRVIGGGG